MKMIGRHSASLLILLACIGANLAQTPVPQITECQQKFRDQMTALGMNKTGYRLYGFIDKDTPDDACTIQLCQGDFAACDPKNNTNIVKEDLMLVFSDEFEQEDRKFGVQDGDYRWTAEDIYYFPTQDLEVYKPEQVTTYNGKCIITIEKSSRPISAKTLQPNGDVWDVFKNFKSGMMNTWNKWCFTGGYMEISVQLPGSPDIPGFWPAFWAMGNLGRAGYMPSTAGLWPYSYNQCGDGATMSSAIPGSKVPSQILPQCDALSTINREIYGMMNGTARNAPEFDVFEIVVLRNKGAEASQTLQMAPLLPPGQSWADLAWYNKKGIPQGVQYPGSYSYLNTNFNGWSGLFGRPGNAYQDSMSATSMLNSTFYKSQHTFGVDWAPGEYLRWYVDGIFAYEINPNALLPRNGTYANGTTYTIGERIIPVEPMYIIMNLGMSEDFGEVDIQNLALPSYMLIDYVRVYQRPESLNVGCSPPGKPTEQWINCHKNKYTTSKKDDVLFGPCNGAGCLTPNAVMWVVSMVMALASFLL